MSEENGIISPLLPSQTSEQFILNVANSPTTSDQCLGKNHHHDVAHSGFSNPFRFIGCDELSVPSQATVDPFLNDTPDIGGVYEWVKILLCLPIVVVRLVLLAVSLLVGYTVTRLAVGGLKDEQSPMPSLRRRVMWITRFCARCVLFSFGPEYFELLSFSIHCCYQYIKMEGKTAPREVAPIIVSNHTSYIELIFFFYELFPSAVASVSHDSMPIVGAIIRAMQVLRIINGTGGQGNKGGKFSLVCSTLADMFMAYKTSYAMATALNVVQTKHAYRDSVLHMKALEAKQDNPLNYMVEMARVESIFAFMDVEKKVTITFRQFLYGLVNVLKQPLFREACELAFVECGGLVNGFIVEQQFQDSIQIAIPGWKDNEVHELFLLFDHDINEFVGKDDFVACLRRNPLLIALLMPLLQHKNLFGANEVLEIIR